jgi:glycerate 2-kinase
MTHLDYHFLWGDSPADSLQSNSNLTATEFQQFQIVGCWLLVASVYNPAMPDSAPSSLDATSDQQFREMRDRVRGIFDHALRECSIPHAFSRKFQHDRRYIKIGEELYDLAAFSRALVVSIGKAGHSMAEALAMIVGTGLSGIIATSAPPTAQLFGFRYFTGGHPMPNEESLRAGDAILRLLSGLTPETLVTFLISGGASAIAEKPISASISLADLVQTYRALVHSGAPIAEINAIRKHLSALKGGRLALAAAPAYQLSVLVSDVPDHSPDALASGPTMPDSTTVSHCYEIADRHKMLPNFPGPIRAMFERRTLRETPKETDPAFARSHYVTVLSNASAVHAAVESAALAGFAVEVDNSCDDCDYKDVADHLLRRLRELRQGVSRVCLISGGEVTVKVGSPSGVGGRNQHFALYCAEKIAGENITLLSAGTDGIDGNSPAAGAIADGSTAFRVQQRGFTVSTALQQFDGFPLFDAIGDAVMTGPTGNNVRDLRILLAY